MENPHVHENLQHIQAVLSNYDTSFLSDDEEDYCPLCMETLDITDKNFKPCPCGYQICQFCYNNIRQNPELNGRCPACRRKYDDESVEYIVLSPEELKMERAKQARKERERKQREKERKENEYANRKYLAGMRVIQKNLVYVIGLNPPVPYEEVSTLLRSEKYFGQYGKINKIVVNKKTGHNDHQTGYGIYVTFSRKDDAARCIQAVDGTFIDGRQVKAAYGTTKYCSSYLRGQPCPNPNCMFLHEPGEEADSFNKRELNNKQQLQQGQQTAHLHSQSGQQVPLQVNQHIQQQQQQNHHHIHHPSPFKVLHDSTGMTGGNDTSGVPSPAQARTQLHLDDSSSSSTPAAHTPVLTPAPIPTGSNPWGITQSSTPVSALSKASSSNAFPALGEGINIAGNIPSSASVATPSNCNQPGSSSRNKKNSEKQNENPSDPLGSAVKFIDDTINFLSNYQCIDYKLTAGIIDDETYASYPPLFSYANIDVSEESEGILGRKLIDMLAIKPADHVATSFPSQQEVSPQMQQHHQQLQGSQKQLQQQQLQQLQQLQHLQQLQQQQLQQQQQQQLQLHQTTQQAAAAQHNSSDATPQHLNSELHLHHGQQQTKSMVNSPPPGMFIHNNQQNQNIGAVPHTGAQSRSNNSTDLLNQLINGKKVAASN
ncbi:HCL165Cp [Eremothecium sinecaudum]|uniref:HCL165Cp n=1 Tax=Eremothecium sinecaudum TaxID=45286 RepID=A0A0X8HR94_9SACH|nr:HCL165Cp [Eremothecium sinecaudum]AMD19986.1 HCL165Cp [Eremothecium sinecaudum]